MIWIYCCLLGVIAAGIVTNQVIQRTQRRKQQRWGVLWLRQLRELLELFPQHRGMANALLKGDESFRPALEKLQRQVDSRLQSMHQLLDEPGAGCKPSALQPIEQQWQTLRDQLFTLPAKKSFAMHTRLIESVIERMQDDSIELEALACNNESLRMLLIMLTRELPQVVESMGQARGIGTGVAAQRVSNVANRVNLKFLHEKTSSIIDHKLVPAHAVISHYQGMEEVIDRAVSSAREFLDLLDRELIACAKPTVAPDQFYQQGTKAIEAGFQLFDQLFPRCTQSMRLT
jgi:hypothetical protein